MDMVAEQYMQEVADGKISAMLRDIVRGSTKIEVGLRIHTGKRSRYVRLGSIDL